MTIYEKLTVFDVGCVFTLVGLFFSPALFAAGVTLLIIDAVVLAKKAKELDDE